jgi:hypothetical protein
VDVIGHQTTCPDCCAGAPRCCGDQTPIEGIVVGVEKHGLAPITALGDMVGQVRHNNARDPGHACASFSRFEPICEIGYNGAPPSSKLSP